MVKGLVVEPHRNDRHIQHGRNGVMGGPVGALAVSSPNKASTGMPDGVCAPFEGKPLGEMAYVNPQVVEKTARSVCFRRIGAVLPYGS